MPRWRRLEVAVGGRFHDGRGSVVGWFLSRQLGFGGGLMGHLLTVA